jgi:hypothetical protein
MDLWNNLACGRLGEHATQNHWLPEFTQGDFFPKGQKKKIGVACNNNSILTTD